jgi:cysteine desulfurase family protein
MERIYLDNAATSWPKPPEVLAAIQDFYQNIGSASGRGGQSSIYSSDTIVRQCRTELADLLGASVDDEIVFAFNGTDAINLVLGGFLANGDHVVTTVIEHNSVIRPLNELKRERGIQFDLVDCDEQSLVNPAAIRQAINPQTKLVVLSHASNVTGAVQDVQSISEICRRQGVALLVDAAQTVGQINTNVSELGCDFLVAPGHKGLLGPLGTGFVFVHSRVKGSMKAWRAGGTGTESELAEQPQKFPGRLESGNLNVGGIAGLLAGIRFVQGIGLTQIAIKEQSLIEMATSGLREIAGVQLACGGEGLARVGVMSLELENMDPREVAMILDTSFGIQTRAGLHCAPLIHQRLGTFEQGGTVRISPSWFSQPEEIEKLIEAFKEIATG